MSRRIILALFCALAISTIGSTAALAKRLVPVETDPAATSGLTIEVRDETKALSDASVWVETHDGKLLVEGKTAADGRFIADVADEVIKNGVSITAHASGHSAVSFLENVAHRVTLELPVLPEDKYAVLNGKLRGFKESDDEMDAMVGLVAKAFELTDLAQLDSSSFVSPLKDTINVFGPREIPSNIVLPDQTFPIYFIPVRVNKPTYRLPALAGSSARYFGVTGLVNVQDAVRAIRNNDGWAIVNLLEFGKVGLSGVVQAPEKNRATLRVDMNTDVEVRERVRLRPGRSGSASGVTNRLVVALWEPTPGLFVPTGIKKVEDDDITLTTVENRSAKILDVLVSEDGSRFRGAWLDKASSKMPDVDLNADLDAQSIGGGWVVKGGEEAHLMVAHVENKKTTSVGSTRYEDSWIVVSPRRGYLRLPAVAYAALGGQLGKISHVSLDLMQTSYGRYPFIYGITQGATQAEGLAAFEKVRKEMR